MVGTLGRSWRAALRSSTCTAPRRQQGRLRPRPGAADGCRGRGALDTRWPGVGALAIETGAASYEELYEQVNGRPFPLPRAEAADRCTFGDISTLLTVQTLCVLLYHGECLELSRTHQRVLQPRARWPRDIGQ